MEWPSALRTCTRARERENGNNGRGQTAAHHTTYGAEACAANGWMVAWACTVRPVPSGALVDVHQRDVEQGVGGVAEHEGGLRGASVEEQASALDHHNVDEGEDSARDVLLQAEWPIKNKGDTLSGQARISLRPKGSHLRGKGLAPPTAR